MSKNRIGAALGMGALICILAGCGGSEYKAQTTGGESQVNMIKPGQPLQPPSGAPGMDKIGQPTTPPMGGQPMTPPTGAPK